MRNRKTNIGQKENYFNKIFNKSNYEKEREHGRQNENRSDAGYWQNGI